VTFDALTFQIIITDTTSVNKGFLIQVSVSQTFLGDYIYDFSLNRQEDIYSVDQSNHMEMCTEVL
jgi:hypothetical protein